MVTTELEKEVGQRSLFMVRQLSDTVCSLNDSLYFFSLGMRHSQNTLLFQANLRHLRVREHLKTLNGTFLDLANIKTAESIHECQLREAVQFGDFPELQKLLEKEQRLRHIRKFGKIAEILGEEFLKVNYLNMRCYILKFPNDSRPPVILEDNEILPSPPLSKANSPQVGFTESNELPLSEFFVKSFEISEEVSRSLKTVSVHKFHD